jgi:soluble lytic murein transglycosylase-like protein
MHVSVLRARPKLVLVLLLLVFEAGVLTLATRADGTTTTVLPAGGPAALVDAGPAKLWMAALLGNLPAPAPAAPAPAAPPAEQAAPPAAEAAAAPAETARALPPVPPAPPAEVVVVPPARKGLRPVLVRAAREHGLPAEVVLAQAWAESSWRENAVSHANAIGVLQLTPDTVEFVSRRLLKLDRNLDPLDPAANARMGARYMRHLLDRTGGDWRQALIAYNQGLRALRRDGPYPEAATYADRVLSLRSQFLQP